MAVCTNCKKVFWDCCGERSLCFGCVQGKVKELIARHELRLSPSKKGGAVAL